MKKTNFRAMGSASLAGAAMVTLLAGCTTYVETAPPPAVVVTQPPVVVEPQPVVVVQPPPTEVVVIHEERDFYEPLNPYGRWVDVPGYGRCWAPAQVGPDWQPYSAGHWERTDAGWYWVSDEPWGWATYHYGRWFLDARLGWLWIPQTQWAPAWVTFHQGGGYVGWAPLPPNAQFRPDGSCQIDERNRKPREYVFVEEHNFMRPVRPTTIVVNNTTIINKTVNITNVKIVNNTVVNEGPRREVIEKSTGVAVTAVAVNDLRRRQEAPVVAKRNVTIAAQPSAQKQAQHEARLKAVQAEEKARADQAAARARAEADAKAEAQRKAQEAALKAAQQKAAQQKAAQEAAARKANELRAQQEAAKKAQEEARLKAAQAQQQAKAAQEKAAQEAAARRAAEARAQQDAQKKAQDEARQKAAQAEAARKPAPAMADPQVHARAKAALAAVPEFKGVKVATTNGVVHLTGTVASADHKKRAEEVTRKVEGVRNVQNNLTVKQ